MCADLLNRVPGPVEQALKSSAIPLVRQKYNNQEVVGVKTDHSIFNRVDIFSFSLQKSISCFKDIFFIFVWLHLMNSLIPFERTIEQTRETMPLASKQLLHYDSK